jgi:hypothetical protein
VRWSRWKQRLRPPSGPQGTTHGRCSPSNTVSPLTKEIALSLLIIASLALALTLTVAALVHQVRLRRALQSLVRQLLSALRRSRRA